MDSFGADLVERTDRLSRLAEQRLALTVAGSASHERARQLRDHLDGFIGPRAADIDAPLLVLLLGPTGAGKSSLLNTIAGAEVSTAGVLRPTTREAVLYATEADAERILSSGRLKRVARERITLSAAPARSAGVAVIDAPDIDSIERDNRELADVLVEASDLCVFVTTATRYADLVPWQVLRRVNERGLPIIVVVNRLPQDARDRDEVLADTRRLLTELGLDGIDVIAIGEGDLDPSVNGLSRERAQALLDNIAHLSSEADERRAMAIDALSGAIKGLAPLVHNVADDLEHEAIDAEALRRIAQTSYDAEREALAASLSGGVLLRAEVLRRWNDFVGADQVARFISTGLGRLRAMLLTAFRGGAPAPVSVVEEEMTSTLEALALRHASDAARRTASAWSERTAAAELVSRDPALWSASAGFAPAIREGLGVWMGEILDDVRGQAARKKAVSQIAALGVNVVGVAVMLGVFIHTAGITGAEVGIAAGTAFLNQKLLEALFGERAMEELIGRARAKLEALFESLFARERARFEDLVPPPTTLRELATSLRESVEGMHA